MPARAWLHPSARWSASNEPTSPLPAPSGAGIGGYLSTIVIRDNEITENEILGILEK